MYSESFAQKIGTYPSRGWIEVVCGSMFSGKTEELIRRLRRAQIASQKVAIFKPKLDDRYDKSKIVSHDNNSIDSIPVGSAQEILKQIDDIKVIGIDEVQFFDKDIIEVAETLANEGKRVILAGLDMNYLGEPFGPMPDLLARAESITKLHAICDICGQEAGFSYRLTGDDGEIALGEKDKYQARCRQCKNDSTSDK